MSAPIPEVDERGLKQSLWAATARPGDSWPRLMEQQRVDVAVIGGGYAGLSAALHLAERGASVAVLEAREPGWGASGRNGGQVIPGFKRDLKQMAASVGYARAEAMVAFGDAAAEATFSLIERLGLDCGARQEGSLVGAHGPGALKAMEEQARRLSAQGYPVAVLSAAEAADCTGIGWYRGAYLDRRGGTLHPLDYARALAGAAAAAGAAIFVDTLVTAVTRETGSWRVKTRSGASVRAERVLLCTNAYSDLADLVPRLSRSIVPFYSYQAATGPLPPPILKTLPPSGLGVTECRRVLSYCRVDGSGRFVMGARGALNGSLRQSAFDLVRARLGELFPDLAGFPLEFFWNGRVAVTPDYLPRLLEVASGVHAALGWSGRGVAITTAAGPVIADWLAGASPNELPLPVTVPRQIPLHFLKGPASRLTVGWMHFLDRLERRQHA